MDTIKLVEDNMEYKVLEYNGTDKYWSVLFQDKNKELFAVFAQLKEEPYVEKFYGEPYSNLIVPLNYKANRIKLNNIEEYKVINRILPLIWGDKND